MSRPRFQTAWLILGVLIAQPLYVAVGLAAILALALKVCGAW